MEEPMEGLTRENLATAPNGLPILTSIMRLSPFRMSYYGRVGSSSIRVSARPAINHLTVQCSRRCVKRLHNCMSHDAWRAMGAYCSDSDGLQGGDTSDHDVAQKRYCTAAKMQMSGLARRRHEFLVKGSPPMFAMAARAQDTLSAHPLSSIGVDL